MLINFILLFLFPLFFTTLNLLISIIIIRISKKEKHLILIFAIGVVVSVLLWKTVEWLQLTNWNGKHYSLFIIINYFLFLACYMGFHSGIEIVSPSMYLMYFLHVNSSVSKSEAINLMTQVSNDRLTKLENSIFIRKQNSMYSLSRFGRVVINLIYKIEKF